MMSEYPPGRRPLPTCPPYSRARRLPPGPVALALSPRRARARRSPMATASSRSRSAAPRRRLRPCGRGARPPSPPRDAMRGPREDALVARARRPPAARVEARSARRALGGGARGARRRCVQVTHPGCSRRARRSSEWARCSPGEQQRRITPGMRRKAERAGTGKKKGEAGRAKPSPHLRDSRLSFRPRPLSALRGARARRLRRAR